MHDSEKIGQTKGFHLRKEINNFNALNKSRNVWAFSDKKDYISSNIPQHPDSFNSLHQGTTLIDIYDASCEDFATAQSNSINPIQDMAQLNSSHQSPIKEVESCEKQSSHVRSMI